MVYINHLLEDSDETDGDSSSEEDAQAQVQAQQVLLLSTDTRQVRYREWHKYDEF